MSMATSLYEFILKLLGDPDAKAAFVANPDKALADAGLQGVCSQDVSDAMSYVAEYHPVTFVGNREYNVGNTNGEHNSDDHHGDDHGSAADHLKYITNNYSYSDSHNTVIDKSVNQNIWNSGHLNQNFTDNSVTATDHSIAAGGDVSKAATGNNDVVGDNNKVGNTDNSINDSFKGNNLADHGSVAGNNSDGNVTNPKDSHVATTDGTVDDSKHDSHDHTTTTTTTDDSVHTTDSFNSHYNDSFNEHSAITHTDQHGDNPLSESHAGQADVAVH
ncbi:MAG TPA: IniB N-terminal domain-containing protein [Pseudonocardiaceae bacterium]